MSNEKFTPGPWKVEAYGQHVFIKAENEHTVCSIGHLFNPFEEANANLIAAAPDMYEALKILVDEIMIDFPDNHAMKLKAKAALSKANPQK